MLLSFLGGSVTKNNAITQLNAIDAVPTADLLDSMGINTHFTFADSPYATRYAEVRNKLLVLGLHHTRDVLHSHVEDLARIGIPTTILAEPNISSPEGFRDRVKALNADGITVDAIEGANEPDMFWSRLHITWEGKGYPDGPVVWQQHLFRVLKADPATQGLVIIGPSLGLAGLPSAQPPETWNGLRAYVDWGNFHPYPYNGNSFGPIMPYGHLRSSYADGTFPSVNLDQSPDAYRAYRLVYGSGPMAATETGYPTGPHFTSEALQAKYLPRLYAENFRLGLKRTYVYQLLDNVKDPSGKDPDASFGLLRYDLSERSSFATVAALAHTLARSQGPGPAPPPELRMSMKVSGAGDFTDASRVHHLLLRRADRTLLLLLWHEVSGEDASTTPRRPIEVPALPAHLEANLRVRFTIDGQSGPLTTQAVFKVPDSILVIEITE